MKEPYRYGSLSQSVDLILLSMEGYYRTLIQPGGLLPQRYGLAQSITLGGLSSLDEIRLHTSVHIVLCSHVLIVTSIHIGMNVDNGA